MPIRKSVLNRAEQARYLAATQELHTAGVDVDVPEEWLQDSRFLDVTVARSPASVAFDLPNGGVGYAICVRLVAVQHGLIVPHCQITTNWDAQIALLNFDERSPICKLGWFTYTRNEVLNQHFDNSLRFHYRGQMIEGTILAMGLKPIPEAYRTGAHISLQLTFGDSLGHEVNVEAELYYEWTTKRKNTSVRRGAGLYEPLIPRETAVAFAREDLRLGDRRHLETNNPQKLE